MTRGLDASRSRNVSITWKKDDTRVTEAQDKAVLGAYGSRLKGDDPFSATNVGAGVRGTEMLAWLHDRRHCVELRHLRSLLLPANETGFKFVYEETGFHPCNGLSNDDAAFVRAMFNSTYGPMLTSSVLIRRSPPALDNLQYAALDWAEYKLSKEAIYRGLSRGAAEQIMREHEELAREAFEELGCDLDADRGNGSGRAASADAAGTKNTAAYTRSVCQQLRVSATLSSCGTPWSWVSGSEDARARLEEDERSASDAKPMLLGDLATLRQADRPDRYMVRPFPTADYDEGENSYRSSFVVQPATSYNYLLNMALITCQMNHAGLAFPLHVRLRRDWQAFYGQDEVFPSANAHYAGAVLVWFDDTMELPESVNKFHPTAQPCIPLLVYKTRHERVLRNKGYQFFSPFSLASLDGKRVEWGNHSAKKRITFYELRQIMAHLHAAEPEDRWYMYRDADDELDLFVSPNDPTVALNDDGQANVWTGNDDDEESNGLTLVPCTLVWKDEWDEFVVLGKEESPALYGREYVYVEYDEEERRQNTTNLVMVDYTPLEFTEHEGNPPLSRAEYRTVDAGTRALQRIKRYHGLEDNLGEYQTMEPEPDNPELVPEEEEDQEALVLRGGAPEKPKRAVRARLSSPMTSSNLPTPPAPRTRKKREEKVKVLATKEESPEKKRGEAKPKKAAVPTYQEQVRSYFVLSALVREVARESGLASEALHALRLPHIARHLRENLWGRDGVERELGDVLHDVRLHFGARFVRGVAAHRVIRPSDGVEIADGREARDRQLHFWTYLRFAHERAERRGQPMRRWLVMSHTNANAAETLLERSADATVDCVVTNPKGFSPLLGLRARHSGRFRLEVEPDASAAVARMAVANPSYDAVFVDIAKLADYPTALLELCDAHGALSTGRLRDGGTLVLMCRLPLQPSDALARALEGFQSSFDPGSTVAHVDDSDAFPTGLLLFSGFRGRDASSASDAKRAACAQSFETLRAGLYMRRTTWSDLYGSTTAAESGSDVTDAEKPPWPELGRALDAANERMRDLVVEMVDGGTPQKKPPSAAAKRRLFAALSPSVHRLARERELDTSRNAVLPRRWQATHASGYFYVERPVFRELPYVHGVRDLEGRCHWGQYKLLVSELDFFARARRALGGSRVPKTVVYVGAANGMHLPIIADLFPELAIHAYDGAPFSDGARLHPRVTTFEGRDGFVTDAALPTISARARAAHAASVVDGKDPPLLFVSDIRISPDDVAVNKDMVDQARWGVALDADMMMLKFRLPYPAPDGSIRVRSPSAHDFPAGVRKTSRSQTARAGRYLYLDGIVQPQVFAPTHSTEARLIATKPYSLREYDPVLYESNMNAYNAVLRRVLFVNAPNVDLHVFGFDRGIECLMTFIAARAYLSTLRTEQGQSQATSFVGQPLDLDSLDADSLRSALDGLHVGGAAEFARAVRLLAWMDGRMQRATGRQLYDCVTHTLKDYMRKHGRREDGKRMPLQERALLDAWLTYKQRRQAYEVEAWEAANADRPIGGRDHLRDPRQQQ